jgi:hypothetical protein
LEKSTSYEAPHYAVFSNLMSLHPSLVQIFSTPSVCGPLLMSRVQVPQQQRITGKIIVSYILIFMFLDSSRKTKGSGLNGSKLYRSSGSS